MYSEGLFQRFRTRIAVREDSGESCTYGEIHGWANELYQSINHRCLVFCLCRNSLEALIGYISSLSNRIVPLMLDANLDKSMLKSLIDLYQPEYIWSPENLTLQFENAENCFSFRNYKLLAFKPKVDVHLYENLALLLTTSGSTGSPKLVRLSYDNVLSNADSIAQYLEITDQERPITTLPMHYSFGLSVINSHFLKGACLLLTDRTLWEKEFWTFLKNEQATSISGVPYTFEILKKLRFTRMELPHLNTLTQAGGKLNEELNREFSEHCLQTGKKFYVMYGQTEATARMSYLPPQYSLAKLGSMGIAIPGGEFKLVDESGKLIEENDCVGELVYKGRNVSLGYAERAEDLAKGDENKGTLITGDLAKRDNDGFYTIVGRKKRFIKIFGNRINLDEAERLIKNIIPDCACGGSDDQMVIYLTDIEKQNEVIQYISSKTGIHLQAFSVKHIERIPKNSSGKTIYSELN